MDVTAELAAIENAIRDFIASTLSSALGKDWIERCGVTDERLKVWKDRQVTEQKRQRSGAADTRLIYYADFYDLRTILGTNWTHFAEALGDWRTIEVFLIEMERLRDPDAHRRGLLPHQKNLIVGISGEIRNRLIRYRSKQETGEDYYPRIESVADNLGNFWSPSTGLGNHLYTGMKLRPGDLLQFVVTAHDPLGEPLLYRQGLVHGRWQDSPEFQYKVSERDVGGEFEVYLSVKSRRRFHASTRLDTVDHSVGFHYTVLPPKEQSG